MCLFESSDLCLSHNKGRWKKLPNGSFVLAQCCKKGNCDISQMCVILSSYKKWMKDKRQKTETFWMITIPHWWHTWIQLPWEQFTCYVQLSRRHIRHNSLSRFCSASIHTHTQTFTNIPQQFPCDSNAALNHAWIVVFVKTLGARWGHFQHHHASHWLTFKTTAKERDQKRPCYLHIS